MHGRDDFDQLMRWGERLRLYGQLQGVYYEQLTGMGFDPEHAFQLVREWTSRTIGWTMTDGRVLEPSMFGMMPVPPPEAVETQGDYLISPDHPKAMPPEFENEAISAEHSQFGVVTELWPEPQSPGAAGAHGDDPWLDEDVA